MEKSLQRSTSITILAPHADDECIGCGGAIMNHLKQGDRVNVIFLTMGDNTESTQNSSSVRFNEMLNATKILGISRENIISLGLAEQKIKNTDTTYNLLKKRLSQFKSEIIYCPNKHELDNDHREVNQLLEKHLQADSAYLKEIRYYEVWSTLSKFNLAIDITNYFQKKISALECYQSQLVIKRYDLCVKALNFYRGVMQENGGKFAEVFHQRYLQ